MPHLMKVRFAQKPTHLLQLSLIKDAAFLPLCTLVLHQKHWTQKQQKRRLKFLTLSNEIICIVLLPKECHQSLNLCTVCFSEQTPSLWRLPKNWSIALLLGWLALCTISNTHLHLHSLKPITKVPRTATRIPPGTAKNQVCWLLKRCREQSKLRSRKHSQLRRLFTSFLPLQQSQLNQWYTDRPLRGHRLPSHTGVYFIPVPKI